MSSALEDTLQVPRLFAIQAILKDDMEQKLLMPLLRRHRERQGTAGEFSPNSRNNGNLGPASMKTREKFYKPKSNLQLFSNSSVQSAEFYQNNMFTGIIRGFNYLKIS